MGSKFLPGREQDDGLGGQSRDGATRQSRVGQRDGDSGPALSPEPAHLLQASPESPSKFSLRLTPLREAA